MQEMVDAHDRPARTPWDRLEELRDAIALLDGVLRIGAEPTG